MTTVTLPRSARTMAPLPRGSWSPPCRSPRRLSTKPEGPSVSVVDENGVIRGRILVNQLGSFLSLMDPKGKTRVGSGVTQNGGAVSVLDEESKERLTIAAPGS